MPEKVGVRVMPLVIVATLGPETVFHSRLAIVPSESVAVAPVGAEVLVGKVIALSGPALTVGGTLGTVTGVHPPQLLSSFVPSFTVPTKDALLSAQALMYLVPVVAKVYGVEVGTIPPE